MSTKPSVSYAVERLEWRAVRHVGKGYSDVDWEGYVRLPGARRLRTFATAEEADAFCGEQEAAMRAKVNPFSCGGPALHYQSHLDAGRLRDWLLDAGIDPPPADELIDWHTWYESAQFRAPQRAAVWQALDRVRFFRVVERPASARTAFVVMHREWDYNDEWYFSTEVKPVEAYSTREKAEAVRQRRERTERQSWEGAGLEVNGLRWAQLRPGDPLPKRRREELAREDEDGLFYEVVEIDVGE